MTEPLHRPLSVNVRPALASEYDAVAALVERGFRHGPYGQLPVSAERRALVRDSAARAAAGALLVAVDDSAGGGQAELLGTVSLLRPGTSASRLAIPGEAELRLLAVSVESRGRGVGEALVRGTFPVGSHWGVDAIVLDTGAFNLSAQRLYDRIGFRRIPERAGDYAMPAGGTAVAYRYAFPKLG